MFLLTSLFIWSVFFCGLNCSLISDQKIYKNIQSDFICFRRFNSTHEFGCQSDIKGSVGTIQLINSSEDIETVISKGKNQPYIPCLDTKFFNSENLIKFKESKRVKGLVLFDVPSEDKLPEFLTEDKKCPNEFSSYYKKDPKFGQCLNWNSVANSNAISELNLNFPIILIRDKTNITNIKNCYKDFNHGKDNQVPNKLNSLLCSLQLETWMVGAKNSKTCMSRNGNNFIFEPIAYCDSISSLNIFSSLYPYTDQNFSERSVIMLVSKLDSLSIFDNAASGASTVLVSLITMFSTMKILKELNQKHDVFTYKNVLYSFFDGEAYDYVGSGRTAYDLGTDGLLPLKLKNVEFPDIKLLKNHIHSVIELNQVDTEDKFNIFTDPLTRDKPRIKKQLSEYINPLIKSDYFEEEKDLPLPPSSIQQLLSHDEDLPVLLIANHKEKYTNNFYNSFLDDSRTIKNKDRTINNIKILSENLGKTIFSVVLGENVKDKNMVEADIDLIKKLYECFIINSKCKFFEEIRGEKSVLPKHINTYPLYISVSKYAEQQPYHYEYLMTLFRLNSYLNGKTILNIKNKNDCLELNKKDNNVIYEWFNVSSKNNLENYELSCIETTKFFTIAKSPVFINDEPNWSLNYSTWTESIWETPKARIFVTPSYLQEYITFFVGFSILILSYFFTKWLNKNSRSLFLELRQDNNMAVSGL